MCVLKVNRYWFPFGLKCFWNSICLVQKYLTFVLYQPMISLLLQIHIQVNSWCVKYSGKHFPLSYFQRKLPWSRKFLLSKISAFFSGLFIISDYENKEWDTTHTLTHTHTYGHVLLNNRDTFWENSLLSNFLLVQTS